MMTRDPPEKKFYEKESKIIKKKSRFRVKNRHRKYI